MKIYVMISDNSSLILNDGLPVSQRFHKDKETGEKKYYPIGTYNLDKARSQYFFLNKYLQDQILENDLKRIDNIIFKEHSNIPDLKIAFSSPKDTSAYIVFDGYKRENITFVKNTDFAEAPCPYNGKISKHYNIDSDKHAYRCPYCDESEPVAESEEDVDEYTAEMSLDNSINPKKLMKKLFHIFRGDVSIYEEADYSVDNFLDTFAVTIADGQTINFLLTKKIKDETTGRDYERQYLVEFTYRTGQKPTLAISLLENRGFTKAQYDKLCNEAKNFENSLKQPGNTSETETQTVFYFPDKVEDESDSPFKGLREMVGENAE